MAANNKCASQNQNNSSNSGLNSQICQVIATYRFPAQWWYHIPVNFPNQHSSAGQLVTLNCLFDSAEKSSEHLQCLKRVKTPSKVTSKGPLFKFLKIHTDSLIAVLSFGVFGVFNRPKRIKTPHRLFWDLRADKTFTTRWSGGRVQVWVQVRAPACHLAITPEGYSRRQSKDLTAKSIAELLGPRSGTAWAGRTAGAREHKKVAQICAIFRLFFCQVLTLLD